jgi:hypothetical protein
MRLNSGLLLRPSDLELLTKAEEIELGDAKSAGALGFTSRLLLQATMPHSDPGDVAAWGRRNGAFSLVIQPGMMLDAKSQPKSIGLPFGSLPRILLAWISTEAVLTRKPVVILGDTLSSFLRELGLLSTGGRWGSITMLKSQMRRLFSSSISCTYEGKDHWANTGCRLSEETNLWWDPKSPDQTDLWQATVTLGSSFFQDLVAHPVPVDMRVLRALRSSAFALDIYCWLTYRMNNLRKETVIPWSMLQMQFGADYSRLRDFKAKFIENLRKVLICYPQARTKIIGNGFLIKPSRTHIRR